MNAGPLSRVRTAPVAFVHYRAAHGSRTLGLILAVVVEALLVLVVASLSSSILQSTNEDAGPTLIHLRAVQHAATSAGAPSRPRAKSSPSNPRKPAPRPDIPVPPVQVPHLPRVEPTTLPVRPVLLQLSPKELAAADIGSLSKSPVQPFRSARPMMGPTDSGYAIKDTARVEGSGPHGEPLYAAAWYREPYDDELRGYLSAASGPGWGLIACRTAPDFRVEDCVKVDEYPNGSNIARSVLAAAWQFRVRPPRIGGQPKIGEWVRIRIDYDLRKRQTAEKNRG